MKEKKEVVEKKPRKKTVVLEEGVKEGRYFKFLLQLEHSVHERLLAQSLRRFGITATAYIRMALTEKLERDETSEVMMRKKYTR